tara:strand:- start:172 stop:522 length:351 start_codon:yes stop_codon:yes gene_type:complete
MTPGIFNYGNQYRNDTVDSVTFTVRITGTTTVVDLSDVTAVRAQFRKPFNQAIQADYSIGSGITMTDLVGGRVTIDSFMGDWDPGTYSYDVEFIYDTGRVKTYIKGTLNIVDDRTK